MTRSNDKEIRIYGERVAVHPFRQDDPRGRTILECTTCGRLHVERILADYCCANDRRCERCGVLTGSPQQHMCPACYRQHWAEVEADRVANAELVEYDGGYLYVADLGSNNGYFETMEDLLDCLAGEAADDWPEFAILCRHERPSLCAGDVINSLEESMGWEESPVWRGEKELAAAIDAFIAANQDNVTYEPDYRRKCRIQAAE